MKSKKVVQFDVSGGETPGTHQEDTPEKEETSSGDPLEDDMLRSFRASPAEDPKPEKAAKLLS